VLNAVRLRRCAVLLLAAGFLFLIQGFGQQPPSLKEALVVAVLDGDSIRVEFPDSKREEVRYVSISAPESNQCFGVEAKKGNEDLTLGKKVWLELDPSDKDFKRDRNRLLAHVFLDAVQTPSMSVEVKLAASGFVRLDVRDAKDKDIKEKKDFQVRYTPWIIDAQLKAAKAKEGWWGRCDNFADSDLAIGAIKFWSDDNNAEIVYIINRGKQSLNLSAGWTLRDADKRNELEFGKFFAGTDCILPTGALLKVHSGPEIPADKRGRHTPCSQPEIDLYWKGSNVWNNDGDKAELINPEGKIVYVYGLCRNPPLKGV